MFEAWGSNSHIFLHVVSRRCKELLANTITFSKLRAKVEITNPVGGMTAVSHINDLNYPVYSIFIS